MDQRASPQLVNDDTLMYISFMFVSSSLKIHSLVFSSKAGDLAKQAKRIFQIYRPGSTGRPFEIYQ